MFTDDVQPVSVSKPTGFWNRLTREEFIGFAAMEDEPDG
jgi:hypothetical protein